LRILRQTRGERHSEKGECYSPLHHAAS
jgi:hypothetical protein